MFAFGPLLRIMHVVSSRQPGLRSAFSRKKRVIILRKRELHSRSLTHRETSWRRLIHWIFAESYENQSNSDFACHYAMPFSFRIFCAFARQQKEIMKRKNFSFA